MHRPSSRALRSAAVQKLFHRTEEEQEVKLAVKIKTKIHPQSVHMWLPWFQRSVGQRGPSSVPSFVCASQLLYRITDVTTSQENKSNTVCVLSSFRRVFFLFFFFSSVLSKRSSAARRAAESQEASTVLPASLFCFFFTCFKRNKRLPGSFCCTVRSPFCSLTDRRVVLLSLVWTDDAICT